MTSQVLMLLQRSLLLGAICVAAGASNAHAQSLDERTTRRAKVEQRFRDRFTEVVRDKVGLDDEQMRQLMETNRRFELRRRTLLLDERRVRLGLRDELAVGATPNDERVRQLLDDALRLQRERADLLIEEQAELSGFMTPVQRARYFGLQDQLRRKVEELRAPADSLASESATDSAGDKASERRARRRQRRP